jgi:hypothetical protein
VSKVQRKKSPKTAEVEKISTPTWKQQIHKGCGGELVIIAKPGIFAIVCKSCKTVWNIDLSIFGISNLPAALPNDWESYEP